MVMVVLADSPPPRRAMARTRPSPSALERPRARLHAPMVSSVAAQSGACVASELATAGRRRPWRLLSGCS